MRTSPVCEKATEPGGALQQAIVPGLGMKPLAGLSAYTRASKACPYKLKGICCATITLCQH